MQGRKLHPLENARFESKAQSLIFRMRNGIISEALLLLLLLLSHFSEAQTALISVLSKLLFSTNPSACTEDSFSHTCLLGGYHVLTVAGNKQ